MNSTSIVCPEPGKVEVREQALPALKPGEVRVATEATMVSPGTERAWFLAEEGAPVRFPYRPGYCNVGRVIEVGSQVTALAAGDRVLSSAAHTSVYDARPERLTRVPDGVAPEQAAMVPLAAISLQGVRKARLELGSPTAVLGAGLIGLLAMKLTKLAGAFPLIASDISAHRLGVAEQAVGARAVPLAQLAEVAKTIERNPAPDPGFDVVIDATGHPAAVGPAIAACGTAARLVLLGSTRGKAQDVDVYAVHAKGVQIIGAHNRNRPQQGSYHGMWTQGDDFRLLLSLLAAGALDFSALITDRVAPGEVPAVFERLRARDERLLGCVIEWGRKG